MRRISKTLKKGISLKLLMRSSVLYLQRNNYWVLFLLFFSVILLSIIYTEGTLRVKTVLVRGDRAETPFRGTENIKGIFIWQVDEEKINALAQLNPGYTIEDVEKDFPSRVTITVVKQIPGAYLAVDGGYMLLSTESVVLEKTREEPDDLYPIIAFYQRIPFAAYNVGEHIYADEVEDSLYFLGILKQASKERVDSIDIVSYNMLGLYTSNKKFFFSSEKERETQRYQLEQALKQFRIDGTTFTMLDLRFDKPIVKF